jgi:hypothetical protein
MIWVNVFNYDNPLTDYSVAKGLLDRHMFKPSSKIVYETESTVGGSRTRFRIKENVRRYDNVDNYYSIQQRIIFGIWITILNANNYINSLKGAKEILERHNNGPRYETVYEARGR